MNSFFYNYGFLLKIFTIILICVAAIVGSQYASVYFEVNGAIVFFASAILFGAFCLVWWMFTRILNSLFKKNLPFFEGEDYFQLMFIYGIFVFMGSFMSIGKETEGAAVVTKIGEKYTISRHVSRYFPSDNKTTILEEGSFTFKYPGRRYGSEEDTYDVTISYQWTEEGLIYVAKNGLNAAAEAIRLVEWHDISNNKTVHVGMCLGENSTVNLGSCYLQIEKIEN